MNETTGADVFQKFQTAALNSPVTLGALARSRYLIDPKLLPIYLARYKFVSKMVSKDDHVLEIGCADGFAAAIVRQNCRLIDLSDIDNNFLSECRERNPSSNVFWHDFVAAPSSSKYDVIYSLDVIEHIEANSTLPFLVNTRESLDENGTFILGTPSLESQVWASDESRAGHINCRSQKEWLTVLRGVYGRIFSFSMNDEVVHTGFGPMSHYLLFLCVNSKC